ncbi:hypothetical protein [Xenorhabdus bovienii]|uniref:hypothetical protein n=1 Tax=Xenorhabdus bovienii TaxID=40576 RepID=UPI0023B22951|nr:hypothetical protein [Xenorhabdus bovienii]
MITIFSEPSNYLIHDLIFFIAAETDDLNGMDKGLQGELARTALELLNESSPA